MLNQLYKLLRLNELPGGQGKAVDIACLGCIPSDQGDGTGQTLRKSGDDTKLGLWQVHKGSRCHRGGGEGSQQAGEMGWNSTWGCIRQSPASKAEVILPLCSHIVPHP